MMHMSLLSIAVLLTIIPASVYLVYLVGAFTTKNPLVKKLESLPVVSVVIPAYNEESGIADRINNLASVYPVEKLEIIVSNDGSQDRTEEVAKAVLQKHSIKGKVITHERSGVNKAINRGIEYSSNELVVITGADGLFDENTIPDLLSVLLSSDNIGAVSGDLIPVAKGESVFSNSESAYRSIYGRMCTWESKIHSTFCFNGPVVAFKKEASSSLNTRRGADDASMALSVIKKDIGANTCHLRSSMNTFLTNSMNSAGKRYAGLQGFWKLLLSTGMHFLLNLENSEHSFFLSGYFFSLWYLQCSFYLCLFGSSI
jgi:glycosyltransferase involved in cell wall biosynthesis